MRTCLSLTAMVLVCGASFGASIVATDGSAAALGRVGCTPDWIATFGGLPGVSSEVTATAVFDDGTGPALYVAGYFTAAGGVEANRIARWDGNAWSPLGSGFQDEVLALAVYDDGGGPELYAAGPFTSAGGVAANRIAKWDGSAWSPVGLGLSGYAQPTVYSLTVFDDGGGPVLVAGGRFASAGTVAATCVAQWDFDDGSGTALYAAGEFTAAGGLSVLRVAKWDGAAWSALGTGLQSFGGGDARALHAFDDGGGAALYVGGGFTSAGGSSASRVARWDGTSWSALGAGFNSIVEALVSFDDGSGGGPALYAGGFFSMSGGTPVSYIAKWNGASWQQVGGGVDGRVRGASKRGTATRSAVRVARTSTSRTASV